MCPRRYQNHNMPTAIRSRVDGSSADQANAARIVSLSWSRRSIHPRLPGPNSSVSACSATEETQSMICCCTCRVRSGDRRWAAYSRSVSRIR